MSRSDKVTFLDWNVINNVSVVLSSEAAVWPWSVCGAFWARSNVAVNIKNMSM